MRVFETAAAPTGGSWTRSYEVAPGASSRVERNADVELWVVVGGSAVVEVARRITRVEPGSSVLFEPMESHVVHNDSVDTSLCIVAARWAPATAIAA